MNRLPKTRHEGAVKPSTAEIETAHNLPVSFQQGHFAFTLRNRVGNVALLEKRNPNHRRETFEAVIVQIHPPETICGSEYPARESMPPSEDWGTAGWTYTELEDAQRKFCELVAAQKEGTSQPAAALAGAFFVAGSIRQVDATARRLK